MASTWYHYEPLASESAFRLIRLKTLQPRSVSLSDKIEIDLFDASLEFPPKFEAISYAWGQEDSNSTILCNGRLLRVTPNVVSILRALQRGNSVGVLWIDSICIDQYSVSEKNIQVPKMRSIYRKAENVWIWLGKGSFETHATFDFLLEVAAILDRFDSSNDGRNSILKELREPYDLFAAKICESRGFNDAVDTNFIFDVINLPWFHRTWTVQELVLARQATLLCGSKCLPWPRFIAMLQILQEYENKPFLEQNRNPISNPASFYDEMGCYRTLANLVYNPCSDATVSETLELVRTKSSTNPRDKVYGLYGLFDHMQILDLPQVDYGKAVQKVYTEITLAAIESERSLDILHQLCLPSLIPDLPSWVPDWSNTGFVRPISSKSFHASGLSEPFYSFNGLKLTVSGILVDELHELASSTSTCTPNFRRGYNARKDLGNTEEQYSALIELVRTVQAWVRISRRLNAYPTGEPPLEAFYRTVMQDCIAGIPRTANNPVDSAFEKWICIVTANFPDHDIDLQTLHSEVQVMAGYIPIRNDYMNVFGCSMRVEEWADELKIRFFLRVYSHEVATIQHDIFLNTYQRTFFTTRDGYMGIGPRWAKPSDSVALISGFNAPFIVRRNGQYYHLIGPAYIHGIMEGERWDDARLGNITLV